LPILVSQP
jgi:hypothetical protein